MGVPNAMIRVLFPDGTELLATDATDLLSRLGALQWTPLDAFTMKQRLSDRAWAWSGGAVDPALPDHDFLKALEEAGLFALDQLADRAKPSLHPFQQEDPTPAVKEDRRET